MCPALNWWDVDCYVMRHAGLTEAHMGGITDYTCLTHAARITVQFVSIICFQWGGWGADRQLPWNIHLLLRQGLMGCGRKHTRHCRIYLRIKIICTYKHCINITMILGAGRERKSRRTVTKLWSLPVKLASTLLADRLHENIMRGAGVKTSRVISGWKTLALFLHYYHCSGWNQQPKGMNYHPPLKLHRRMRLNLQECGQEPRPRSFFVLLFKPSRDPALHWGWC